MSNTPISRWKLSDSVKLLYGMSSRLFPRKNGRCLCVDQKCATFEEEFKEELDFVIQRYAVSVKL